MARFFYRHFGDDVPWNIEREYNKMLRREKYLEERDAKFMAKSVNFDEVQKVIPDPDSLPISEYEEEQEKRHNNRLDYLPTALEMLKESFPEGYVLVMDYYFGNKKVTMLFLAEKYGMSRRAVKYRLKLSREKLKFFITMYENGG